MRVGQPGSYTEREFEKNVQSFVYDYHDPHLFGTRNIFADLYGGINIESGYGKLIGTIGFRFANFSYIRFGRLSILDGKSFNTISYGWDSRDRDLYPTSGSQFEFGIPLIGYTSYHSINDDNLLSFRIGVTDSDVDNAEIYSSLYEVKYTRLFEFNETTGTYSGLSLTLGYKEGYVLGAQYRHQTDSMVYNFGVSVEFLGGEQ